MSLAECAVPSANDTGKIRVPLIPSANLDADRFDWAKTKLAQLLPHAPSRIVYDIGAGTSPMRPATIASGGQWKGFDLSPASPDVDQWDIECPPPAHLEKGGIVMMLEVVEHLRNPWQGLANAVDALSDGGYLLLSTPNPRWSRSRMHALAFGVPACFTEEDMRINHHVFTPWPHIIQKMLLDNGMHLVSYETLEGRTRLPGPPFNHRYPVRLLLSVVNRYIEHRDSSACGMAYGLVARKGA